MKFISCIRTFIIAAAIAVGFAAETNCMVKALSTNFTKHITQKNMAYGLKVAKTFAVSHKYKLGFGALALSALGAAAYRSSSRRAKQQVQVDTKRSTDAAAEAERAKRLEQDAAAPTADATRVEAARLEAQKNAEAERLAQVAAQEKREKQELENARLLEAERAEAEQLAQAIKAEKDKATAMRKRVTVFQKNVEEMQSQIDSLMFDFRTNGKAVPKNFHKGLDLCGFLASGSTDLSGHGVGEIFTMFSKKKPVTPNSLAARPVLREYADAYLESLENILDGIKQAIVPIDQDMADINEELIENYEIAEKARVYAFSQLKQKLNS